MTVCEKMNEIGLFFALFFSTIVCYALVTRNVSDLTQAAKGCPLNAHNEEGEGWGKQS